MEDDQTAKLLDSAVHDLAQDLQVIAMVVSAIESRDGERHAEALAQARRALERLDRRLEDLAGLARRRLR